MSLDYSYLKFNGKLWVDNCLNFVPRCAAARLQIGLD
jgi:hypothetical protein